MSSLLCRRIYSLELDGCVGSVRWSLPTSHIPCLRLTRVIGFCAVYFCFTFISSLGQAQRPAEDATLEAMCRNGLAATAVRYAEVQRELASDDASLYSKWTMRLMECYAQGALRGTSDAADWENCSSTYQDFLKSRPGDSRLPWLTWQLTRCDLLNAQSKLARFLAVPALNRERDEALALVRRIERQLESLEDDIQRRLPLAARQGISGGPEAPAEQLAKLLVDTGLLRCEALLIRSRMYETGSRDRIAAASDVESQAADVLKRTGQDWPSRDALLIAKATAELELGKSAEALAELIRLASDAAEINVRHRAAMIAIETLTATGEVSSARRLLPLLSDLASGAEGEIAKMQIAIADLPGDKSEDRDRQLAIIVQRAKQLGDEYGTYWRNRAEALLRKAASPGSTSTGAEVAVDLMIVEVRQLLAADRAQEAVQRLLQFRDNEAAAGRGNTAIQLASMASALLQREGKWLEAADALASICLDFPQAEQASEAHVRATYALSQALRQVSGNNEIAAQYESALTRQLELWPDSHATDEAQLWLGRWLGGLQKTEAFAGTLLVRATNCRDRTIAARVLLDWLAVVLAVPESQHRRQLADDMQQQIDNGAFEASQQTARVVQLTALAYSQWPSQEETKQLLAAANRLATSTSAPEDRMLLLAVELLLQVQAGKTPANGITKAWLPIDLPLELRKGLALALVEAVGELPIGYQARWARELKFDKRWADELIQDLNVASKAAGLRMQQWCGEADVALQHLGELSVANPRNGPLQLQLSAALADSGTGGLAESTRLARQLAANSRPGSELYLASRWRLIRNYLLQGDREKAKATARLVLAAQPLDSGVWLERFREAAQVPKFSNNGVER